MGTLVDGIYKSKKLSFIDAAPSVAPLKVICFTILPARKLSFQASASADLYTIYIAEGG